MVTSDAGSSEMFSHAFLDVGTVASGTIAPAASSSEIPRPLLSGGGHGLGSS